MDLDLLRRINAHALDPRPDLILVFLGVVKHAQLALEDLAELAVVVQLADLGRLLDRASLVALAGLVVFHRNSFNHSLHLDRRCRFYRGYAGRPRRDFLCCDVVLLNHLGQLLWRVWQLD